MKRAEVLKKVKKEAKDRGLPFDTIELTRHTGVIVGSFRTTLGRHSEIPDGTAHAFWDQFQPIFGKGWWR